MLRTLLVVATLSLLTAGCFGDDPEPTSPGAPAVAAEEPTPTTTEGSVTGEIRTVYLEPLVMAPVGLVAEGAEDAVYVTATDTQGRFTINDVEPGRYVAHVAPFCCVPVLRPITVTSENITEVNLLLEPLGKAFPFVVENEWHGFVDCSLGTLGGGVNACVFNEFVGADPNRDVTHEYTVKQGLRTVVVGMEWDATDAIAGEDLAIYVRKVADYHYYGSAEGKSPLMIRIGDEDAVNQPEDARFSTIPEEGREMSFMVWAGGETVTVTYQQPFTVYWQEYYHLAAPVDVDPFPPT